MVELRKLSDHPHTRLPWLDAYHHFNFGPHRHVGRNGWGSLLVWNDDTIDPHTGFDMHGHRDMEIITYVREGAISHQDHLGNEGRTEAGDVQVMSAGNGITHAEHNQEDDPTRIFQIWIAPQETGGAPHWDQAAFPKADRTGLLVPLASGQGHDGALPIRADAAVFGATLTPGQTVSHQLGEGRYAYVVPATGRLLVNGTPVDARDGAAIKDVTAITIEADGPDAAELLLADIPA